MSLNEILSQFGLEYKEDDVYLALLELGTASVQEIAIKANIKRTTTYDVLSTLIKKGLVSQTQKGKKRLFFAEEPEKLNRLLEEKKRWLEEIMPILKSLHNTAGTKPKILFHEGKNGLKEVYRDTLNHQGELLAFLNENIIKFLGDDFAAEYIEKRKKAKIAVRAIVPDTEEMREYHRLDASYLKLSRLVPKNKFPFTIEMNIYGNRIAFISFKEEMGIIIESTEIARNMSLLFELAWMGAEKHG